MKRGLCLAAALLAVWGLLTFALGRLDGLMAPAVRPVSVTRAAPLILDAGHGGEDGGAVSVTGVPESRVNLEIVQKLRDILALYGVDPVVLREEDVSLHDPEASTLREKKRSDLKNRVRAVEAVEGGDPAEYPPEQLPGQPVPGGAGVLRPHPGLPGVGGAAPDGFAGGAPAGQRPAGQAHPGVRLPDEPRLLSRRTGGVRLPHQPGGGGPAAGRGLSEAAGGGAGRGVADGDIVWEYMTLQYRKENGRDAQASLPER